MTTSFEDPLYGYGQNFPSNEVVMTYEYSRWVGDDWSPQTAKLNILGRRAIVYDFFALGFGENVHRTAYNVLYGDGSVKAYRDRNQVILAQRYRHALRPSRRQAGPGRVQQCSLCATKMDVEMMQTDLA